MRSHGQVGLGAGLTLKPLLFTRIAVLAFGLLLPLHLPPAIRSAVGPDKVVGWWTVSTSERGGERVVVNRTTWHGAAAGLGVGDVLVEVDGAPATAERVARARALAQPGDTIRLHVRRGQADLSMNVPVMESSPSYSSYRWYRLALAVLMWAVGLGLVALRGAREAPVVLGGALLLLAPVTVTVVFPDGGIVLDVANYLWLLAGAAYRSFFPILLLTFLALHVPRAAAMLGTRTRWMVFGVGLLAILAATTHGFTEPAAWNVPSPEQNLRTGLGLLAEAVGLSGIVLFRRELARQPRAIRWLSFAIGLLFTVGILLSLGVIVMPENSAAIEVLRQVKALAVAPLPIAAIIYGLNEGAASQEVWNESVETATTISFALTGLYGFAVAGAAAIVLSSLGASLGGREWLLFSAVFLATIVFSPVLRWSREMVDRHVFSRWLAMERRARDLVDQIGEELEPERIRQRVHEGLPAIFHGGFAELVLVEELVESWERSSEAFLVEPRESLERRLSDPRPGGAPVLVPVRHPQGPLMGAIEFSASRMLELSVPDEGILHTIAQGVGAALRNADSFSRLHRAERELAENERVAALGALAAGLAHEIKNPLASLKMGLYLLNREGGCDAKTSRRIERDVVRIDDLVSSLLRATRQDDADRNVRSSLVGAVRESVADLAPLAEDRGMVLKHELPREDVVVLGTASELRVIASNLIRNAIDAGQDGDEVRVRVRSDGAEAELMVADTCRGLPPGVGDRIFDFGFSTKPDGLGLGLVLARKETERLGGRIDLVSHAGIGTELRVLLPTLI